MKSLGRAAAPWVMLWAATNPARCESAYCMACVALGLYMPGRMNRVTWCMALPAGTPNHTALPPRPVRTHMGTLGVPASAGTYSSVNQRRDSAGVGGVGWEAPRRNADIARVGGAGVAL